MSQTWEDMKRAAQSVYKGTGNIFQGIYTDIGTAYQQIMMSGKLYPQADRTAINQEIAESSYQPTAEDWQEYGRWHDEHRGPDPEPHDLEPER